ncbi:MAG: hypothetical protein GF370_03910 [Candidatus Nealsonbacteria bacterium]|nr:hypothetical protein [Candidatus Nealsonbacteria bacterium]
MNGLKILSTLIFIIIGGLVLSFLFSSLSALASFSLYNLSDTISSSQAATGSDHLIKFKISTEMPASGKLVITPEAGAFNVPAGFDYTDVDLATAVDINATFTERALGASPDAATDGVSVVSGVTSSITITLNSSAGISAGHAVRIKLGENATYGTAGDQQITNPSALGSYNIYLKSYDATDGFLDRGTAMIAIVNPVDASATQEIDETPPYRYNGSPSGAVPVGTTALTMSLNTDEYAYCRYSASSGIPYASSTNIISDELSLFHSVVLSGLEPGEHNYYIRCQDAWGNTNDDDYLISFTIPVPGTGEEEEGGPTGGGGAPYPRPPGLPAVQIIGWAYPNSNVSILRDGVLEKELQADTTGDFNYDIGEIEGGVYTFSVWARDSQGRRSITDSATFLIKPETRTTLQTFLPPTIGVSSDTIGIGETLEMSGESLPMASVEVMIYPSRDVETEVPEEDIITMGVEADSAGRWNLSFDTTGLEKDTYAAKARVSASRAGISNFGRVVYFGIGAPPAVSYCERSDLNKDGSVNLVDFSILLYHWGTSNTTADINLDGGVNLTDFSIMMYCWTG